MFRVGLTGGIASGKTAVARAFEARGIPVIDTDQLARDVVRPGTPGLAAVVAAFGSDFLTPAGELDRRRLRELVFSDAERRRQLEAILHPAIRAAIDTELAKIHAPYVVIAIPLLAEGGRRDRVERVLVVDCPPEVQKARLIARDGGTPAAADAIIAAQATRAERLAIADDRIVNDGSLADLDAAVAELHRRYLSLAADHAAADPGART
jgi:dephospho-CoA kinase